MTPTITETDDMAKAKRKGAEPGSRTRFPERMPLLLTAEQREGLERVQAETGAPIAVTIRRAIDRELERLGIVKAKGGRHGK